MTGPFPDFKDRYDSTGADMREALVEPKRHLARLQTLGQNLGRDRSFIGRVVEGDIRPSLLALPTPATRTTGKLIASGWFATGLIGDFAGDADSYDQDVKALNARHGRLVASRVKSWNHDPDTRDETVDRPGIEASVKSHLHPEFVIIKNRLDAQIRQTEQRLAHGVDAGVTRDLIRRGLIPLSAAGYYPGLALTQLDRTLAQLAAGVDVPLPPGTKPQDVLTWWRSLDPATRTRLIEDIPEFVGNTDGIPAADRNTANRARLPDLITEQEQYVKDHPDDKAAAEDLAGLKTLRTLMYGDGTVEPHPEYQLLLLDNTDHPLKAALSNGSVDDADIVSTWIGGTTSTVKGFTGDMTRMNNLSDEVDRQLALNNDPRSQVGVLWLGYDAPDNIVDPGRREEATNMAKQAWKGWLLPGDQDYLRDAVDILLKDGGDTQDAINTKFAKEGAPALANFAEGIQATNPDARQTASAHSYGGAVLGGAAQRTDAWSSITVSGTPGMQTSDRNDLQVDKVYVSEAQWRDQNWAGTVGSGGRPNYEKLLEILKDGGDFVPDIGQLDDRFGSDPSDLDGVVLYDNGASKHDGRDLTAAHGHSSYWNRDSSSIYNEANSIIDRYDKVATR